MRNVSRTARRAAARLAVILALLGAGVLPACDLNKVLDVHVPGKVPEEALDNPELALTLTRGVIADLECSWNNYVAASALISDQLIQSSGNLNQRNFGTRRVTADDPNYATVTCRDPYGIYTTLQTARYQSEDVYKRLDGFPDAQVTNKPLLKATVRAFGGFALVALGEGFCEMALDGGPLMQPKDVLKVAEARFTDAITLGTQASSADIVNMALVGRARVRLDLGDFAGSIADASKVPPGYVKNVTRDESDPRRYNAICEYITCSQGRHASVAPNYRGLTWGGVPDPRVKITTSGRLGFDNATPHYFPADKFTARSNPLLLASYKEAQLFIAEASARTGDLATARKIINAFHTAANIPAYDAAGAETQDQVIAQVIEERRRELFLEGGHRLNDHLRFRGTKWNIPFRGEPGSIHPNAVDHTGVPYGNTTCFALPVVERTGNPNIKT